jgi:hybrid cluster-associated redox disulfide protein
MNGADLLDTLVCDVLTANPAGARAFADRGMGCVGCPFNRFETLADVARIYGRVAAELATAVESARTSITSGELT